MNETKKIKEEISKRFIEVSLTLIKNHSISSETKFCETISLNNVSFADIKTGKLQIGIHFISILLIKYPEVNGDYILTGRGDVFSNSPPGTKIFCPDCKIKDRTIEEKDKRIADLERLTRVQADFIDVLKEASPISNTGQKRKAG
jgi:hypothetical protein